MSAIPHEGPDFETLMREVDSLLSSQGHPIEDRALYAVREISLRYGIPIPMGGYDAPLPPDVAPHASLGAAIKRWYEANFGERLKVDMRPIRTVVRLGDDLYVLGIPRISGQVTFVMSREFLPPRPHLSAPAVCNVLQLIEHLTPARASRLTDADLEAVQHAFQRAWRAGFTLELTPHEYMVHARADVDTAVNSLMSPNVPFGASKWASLQASEKAFKAALSIHGGKFGYTHNLSELAQNLNDAGVVTDVRELLDRIQCTAKIRYGDEACTETEALSAHHASLDLLNRLTGAGARLATAES